MENREIRVLLVDDSPEQRRLVRLELCEIQDPVFNLQEASRLSEAETELRKGRTDVVLLDLSLPDVTGLQGLVSLCHEFPSLPIVIFTGLDDERIALQALREGGQDFLVKGQTDPAFLKRVLLHAIERKRVDVALSNSRDSLREAQRLETLGRLTSKIAHDFNNILTTILGFSEMLIEDLGDQRSLADVHEIRKASERGAALTNSILSFARREEPSLEALPLNEAIQGISGMIEQLLPETVELKLELESGLPPARADLGQVEQVVVNLAMNARDALPDGGRVKITTGRRELKPEDCSPKARVKPGDYLVLTVEDNGSGMDTTVLDRIFDPFFTTKPRGHGTGLGLSTVISIVRGCGGNIEVTSELGIGTAFLLYFPVFSRESTDFSGLPQASRGGSNGKAHPVAMPPSGTHPESDHRNLIDSSTDGDGRAGKVTESDQLQHLYHVVSHDLHEPLRMVSSYLGLIKRRGNDSLSSDMVEFIDYAMDGSARMQGMLDGVLRYSRKLNDPAVRGETTSLSSVRDKAVKGLAGAETAVWRGENPELEASKAHLVAIFTELLSNALKFADPLRPQVAVDVRHDGDEAWLFEFSDNGQGLPEGDVERCFRLFGRLHGADEYPGLGVGLTVAACLSAKYGADLRLANAAGGGGVAVLRWPRTTKGEEA